MSTSGRVLTPHLELESRQHELFGLDLGEGPTRRGLIFGLLMLSTWCLVWAPFLGVPNKYTFSLYFLPPMIVTVLGMRDSPRTARRRWLTDWALALRYAVVGHQPVIRWGARPPTRRELIPLAQRFAFVIRARDRLWPASVHPVWAEGDDDPRDTEKTPQRRVFRSITIRQKPQLIGGQYFHDRVVMKGKRNVQAH